MSKNTLASRPPFVQGRSIENSRWYMGNVMTFLVNSGLPEHVANYGEVDIGHALRAGKERGISFLSSEEIRQQMPPLAKILARKSAFH